MFGRVIRSTNRVPEGEISAIYGKASGIFLKFLNLEGFLRVSDSIRDFHS